MQNDIGMIIYLDKAGNLIGATDEQHNDLKYGDLRTNPIIGRILQINYFSTLLVDHDGNGELYFRLWSCYWRCNDNIGVPRPDFPHIDPPPGWPVP